ncbi:Putative FMNH2-utilizing oxygenase [Mycobacteroides abscessus subsp. abscessus]|nr:Putative FMNH2-utilizing oxygenase [Mycobacteroides abscessus subsp. abscessus]
MEVVRRLWDSWEDDAEIRDVATGRFIDRDKLHYIDFEGRFFSVKGPSITPRSPQGHVAGPARSSPRRTPTSFSSPRTTGPPPPRSRRVCTTRQGIA